MRGCVGFRITVSLVLCFAVAVISCGCSASESDFPTLPVPETSTTGDKTNNGVDRSSDDINEITVALPYSSETVGYLAKLYYAKTNDLLGENETGADVSLEYLDSIDLPYVINVVFTSDEGASMSNLDEWDSEGNMPDIFLSDDLSGAIENGYCSSLDDYLADNSLLSGNIIYADALSECRSDGVLYGMPYYFSMMLLMGNSDYIPEGDNVALRCTAEELYTYLQEIYQQYSVDEDGNTDEGSEVIPLAGAYKLIPLISSEFAETECSYMLYDEFTNNTGNAEDTLNTVLSYIDDMYGSGLSSDYTADGADPVYARNAALWPASSSEAVVWSEYYPGKLYFLQIPSCSETGGASPVLTVYPICLSQESECPEFACDFAAFISYDTDAILLLQRLEPKTGYLPAVRTQAVWDAVESEDVFGYVATSVRENMDDCVFSPNVINNTLYNAVTDYITAYSIAEYSNTDASDDMVFVPEDCYG